MLCKASIAAGIDAEVIMPAYRQHETTETVYDGIKVTRYAEPTIQNRLHVYGLALPGGIPEFLRCVRRINPDCLHVHGIYAGATITINHLEVAKAAGFPVIYTMHLPLHVCTTQTMLYQHRELCDGLIRTRCVTCNLVHRGIGVLPAKAITAASKLFAVAGVDPGRWNSSAGTALGGVQRTKDLKRNLVRLAVACDKVVYIARWFGGMLEKNGYPKEKLAYIPAGYSAPAIEMPVEVPFHHPGSVKLLFVGRVVPIKDLMLLLEALAVFPEGTFELSIYGDNGDAGYYALCRTRAETVSGIHWRALFDRTTALAIYRRHQLLCLPSAFSEMAPLVIEEAMAAGLPVLASDVYGNREALQNGARGLLFPVLSVDGLRAQLRRFAEDAALRQQLRDSIRPPVPFEEVAARYAGLYQEVIGQNKNVLH